MVIYINMRNEYTDGVETIDEFDTRKEARAMLHEYRMSGHDGVYLSSRSTRDWRER